MTSLSQEVIKYIGGPLQHVASLQLSKHSTTNMLTSDQQNLANRILTNRLKVFRSKNGGTTSNEVILLRLLKIYSGLPADTITIILNSWIT